MSSWSNTNPSRQKNTYFLTAEAQRTQRQELIIIGYLRPPKGIIEALSAADKKTWSIMTPSLKLLKLMKEGYSVKD